MTNHAHGSSLLQARKNHMRRHLHSHNHARTPNDESDGGANHIRSPKEKLQDRQVVVIQTVSVVHIIDEKGAVIDLSTLLPDPVTRLPDTPAVVTPLVTALDNALPSAPIDGPVSLDGAPSPIAPAQIESSLSLPSSSSYSGQESSTSTPLSVTTNSSLSSGVYTSASERPCLWHRAIRRTNVVFSPPIVIL